MSTRLQPFRFFGSQPGFGLLLILSLLHIPAQSRGELAVQIINSAGATPGGTGAFDIVITNPGGPSVDLYGFSIEFTVNSTNVTFTSADTSVNTALGYVFANNAVPALALGGTDQDGFVSDDNYASNGSGGYQFAYQTIAFGETYGLAHISYTMNSGAGLTGDYSVAVLPDSGKQHGQHSRGSRAIDSGSRRVRNARQHGDSLPAKTDIHRKVARLARTACLEHCGFRHVPFLS